MFPTLKLGKHGQASTGTPSAASTRRDKEKEGVTHRAQTHTHTGVHEVRRDLTKGDELDRHR
jgi:hypothetical protein